MPRPHRNGRGRSRSEQMFDTLECELCQNTRECFEKYGLTVCRSCRRTHLPQPSLLTGGP